MLINLFSRNHGIEKLSEVTRLDGALLKFLLLLNTWVRYQVDDIQGQLFIIAPEMLAALKRDQIISQFLRQRWLHYRIGSDTATSPPTHTSAHNNDGQTQLGSADHPLPKFLHIQDHLVPHFVHVSQRLQPKEAHLTEKWMLMASRLMIHAAIEIIDTPGFLDDGVANAKMAVERCFAWGYVPRNRYGSDSPLRRRLLTEIQGSSPELVNNAFEVCQGMINDALILEDDCWQMFFDAGPNEDSMDVDSPLSSGELSDWTRIRQEALDTVLAIFDAVVQQVDEDKLAPVRWLRNQYRLSTLLDDIATFFTVSWNNYHSDKWHGKPILIQIEQGGLKGLTNKEFRLFKQRAAIT